ncbi:MAG: hypothetical protein VYC34_01765 [Planctomycetota bacterium]|nr:hypothetical protein [Planctomycetota bacterium]
MTTPPPEDYKPRPGSLLEGIDDAPARKPIDASWSKRRRVIVGALSAVVAVAALSGAAYAFYMNSAPGLPTTADEALATINSARFDNLSEDRRRQYMAEAGRLFRDMDAEKRRQLFTDEQNREALRAMREEFFDEMARRFARGESMFPEGMQRPRRERPEGEEGQRPPRPEGMEEMTPEQRREAMRNRINEGLNDQISSGNAQSGALRGEMFKRRGAGGPGGGGRRGGGGGGGGGGRGGANNGA